MKAPKIPFFNKSTNNNNSDSRLSFKALFDETFLNYSLTFFYKRIFRDSLLLNFKGKEHFNLGLFGIAKQKNSIMIRSVLDIMVMSAMGINTDSYYPIGITDELSKPLPTNIQGKFCGFIQNVPIGSTRISITPYLTLDWEEGLKPLLHLNTDFLNSMRTLIVANQSPIFKIDPGQLKGNFEIVKKELEKEIQKILESWEKLDKQESIYLPSNSSIDFPQINFESFDYIQTIIAQEISKITGFTITYLLGRQPQGLNATGDKDHLQNIKMFKVYGQQYALPLLQQLIPYLDIPLSEKKDLLDIEYYKTVEELDVAFQYLNQLSTVNIYLKGKERKEMTEIILGLFK